MIPSAGALVATRDPAQAVSKRAPKKKKTYDSDEESDADEDDFDFSAYARPAKRQRAA